MTASVLKQDQDTQNVQKNAIYWDKNTICKFSGNPLSQATKRYLNILPSTGQEKKNLNQKEISDLAFQLIFQRFLLYNCCLSVVL